ncbi:MAG TPA: SDR family oxidoreductase [Nocardioidaceae bacterium]|nr:SDR family oxidoreductase [Nocardioidaceae bacterium]
MPSLPLAGRVALITGVSRRDGIGFAIATRLAEMGAGLFIQHFSLHDAEQPWGADDVTEVVADLRAKQVAGAGFGQTSLDLAAPDSAEALICTARETLGHLDILICNHAKSGDDGTLASMTAERLDMHWQVNARSTLLATRAFAEQYDGRDGGRVIWMTSGQGQGPMNEIAYATSKAALAGITLSVADELVDKGILLNTVNPGPVNTGYLDEGMTDAVGRPILSHFPAGRFGEPDDPARLVAWLVSDEGRWMVGQVLHSEGGFRRW